jgi:hypothetical protein
LPYDSSLTLLPYLNPFMPDNFSFTYCTHSGNPFISNLLSDRISNDNLFLPAIAFQPILQNYRNSNFYYDSKFPFTSVTYKFQGVTQSKEEYLEALFARRLSKVSSMGFTYRLFSNKADNDFQHANDHSFYLYLKSNKKNYFQISQFYFNSFEYQENGGITSDNLINYSSSDFYGTQVNLNNANSKFHQWGLYSTHRIRLLPGVSDSLRSSHLSGGSVSYRFSYESNKKLYTETDPNVDFYRHYYSKNGSLSDSLMLSQITNRIQLDAPQLSRYLPDLKASLSYAYYESFHGGNSDTLLFNSRNKAWQSYNQSWFTADADYHISIFDANISWKSFLLGYGKGDQQLEAFVRLNNLMDSLSYVHFYLSTQIKTPSFFYNSIFLNHYIWNKGDSLNKQKIQEVSGEIYLNALNTKVKGSYFLLKDYISFYNNFPYQTSDWINAYILSIDNLIHLGGFSLKNKVVYQNFDKQYFHLPKLIFSHTAEYAHTFHFSTGGRLFAKLGVDFKYTTRYTPDSYSPPLGIFSLSPESDSSIHYAGDYPAFSAHLTFKVKNVSFYIKYAHFNAWWNTRTFVAAHYPMLPATISYGINWMFYD